MKNRFLPVLLWVLSLILFAPFSQAASSPGFGNLTYSASEVFQVISRIDNDNGIPAELVPTQYGDRHFGINNMFMSNGYMIGVFAPDSGDGVGGWVAYDMSDPRNPVLVKQVYDASTAELRESHSFGQSNMGSGFLVAAQSRFGVEIWDWANVNSPVQVSKLAIPGINSGDYGNVNWQLSWQGSYIYIGRGNAGITIVDVSDPVNPFVVKTLANSNFGGFNIGPIFAFGNRMFVSSMQSTNGFSSLDLSDPENPSLISTVPNATLYYSSCFNGKSAALSTRNVGALMQIYDASDPGGFTLIDDTQPVDDMLYCAFQDDYVFQGSQNFITKIDVSTTPFTTIGSGTLAVAAADHGQVIAFGNVMWVGNDHGTGSGFIVHQQAQDLAPPSVINSSPKAGDTLQALTTRVGVAFSDNILIESLNSTTFQVRKLGTSAALAGNYSVSWGIANFEPNYPLEANTTYEVILNGIEDLVGNAMSGHSYVFSTAATLGHNILLSSDGDALTGNIVNFTGSADPIFGSTVEYSYDFGDGSAATAWSINGSASHSYSSPEHYAVVLSVREDTRNSTGSMIQTVFNPLTASSPTTSQTIIHNGSDVFNVNMDNDTVTKISGTTNTKSWEVDVGASPRALAEAPNGNIWVVNQDDATVSILDASNGNLITTYSLERASAPYGIVFSPNGSNAYITLQASGKLVKLDLNGKKVGEASVGASPQGIAIAGDSATGYVTLFVSPLDHAEVVKVNLSNMTTSTITLQKDTTTQDSQSASRGVPNYLSSITISPDGNRAWVPSNKVNTDRGPFLSGNPAETLTFDSTVRTITSQIDLNSDLEDFSAQVDYDDRAQAKFVAFSALGDYIFLALEGSKGVAVHDAYDGNRVNEITDTGLAPRGLAFNSDHSRLYVHNFMSRSVKVYDTSNILGTITEVTEVSTVANEALNARLLDGKQIFYNAADGRMSLDGYLSCASCHADGDSDGRVWDFTDREEGLRNTTSLLGRHGSGNGNVHWTANFDEIQDFENDIRNGFSGAGFMTDAQFNAGTTSDPLGDPKAGKSIKLDNLAFYVTSLNKYPDSPYRNQDGSLTASAVSGQALFSSKNCTTCHSGDFFTDEQRHDVGTIEASSGQGIGSSLSGVGFDTPSLIGLWKNPPYLHNGQAATIEDVLDNSIHIGSTLTSTEKTQLADYLRQIEYEGAPIIVPDPADITTYDTDLDGVLDTLDNCVTVPNTDQADADGNGIGDACEPPGC